jgi:hypothetical protein
MKKLLFPILIIILLFQLAGCSEKKSDNSAVPDVKAVSSRDKIEASPEVLVWAQMEIDKLIYMLTVDGFPPDDSPSSNLITIEVKENKIINLKLVKTLAFHDNTTIDLYELDFQLLSPNLPDTNIFIADEDGWINSDDNYIYSDANGNEKKNGQLYLLLKNNNGTLTSMGIRRADHLTEQWCKDLLADYNYPPGAKYKWSEQELRKIRKYWEWDVEWSFTMPCNNGYGDTWHVGLGNAYEFGLGIPYEIYGMTSETDEDLGAYAFSNISTRYYDGLTVITLDGFYGNDPDGIGFSVNQYISSTQPDCKTSRGIHVGDTVETLTARYPEVYEKEDYEAVYSKESGGAEHDSCWLYTPEQSNRSILFLTQNDIIVQIDIADGLDEQDTSPRWIGQYESE